MVEPSPRACMPLLSGTRALGWAGVCLAPGLGIWAVPPPRRGCLVPSPCWCRVPSAPVGLQVLGDPWVGVLGLTLAPNKVLVEAGMGWALLGRVREFWGWELQGGWRVPMPLCPHIPLPVVTPQLWGSLCLSFPPPQPRVGAEPQGWPPAQACHEKTPLVLTAVPR